MIDAGPLTQEDADEYRIELDDTSLNGACIQGGPLEGVTLKMSNHDALELAAQLLIGAVYNASDSDFRETAWKQLLAQRLRSARRPA